MTVEWNKDCETFSSEGKSSSGSGGAPITPRERHMLAERERRKSMRELFLSLHSLLPNANRIRKEQSSILAEIIKYIPLAAAQLGSLQKIKDSIPLNRSNKTATVSPTIQVSADTNSLDSSCDCDIRVAPETSLSVAIRVRGDRVNVSLIDSKGTSQTLLLLSAILDEIEAHNLQLVSFTHFRDGSKLLYHSECKISDDGLKKSPAALKTRLQELACKLHKLKKSSTLKRSFDQLNMTN
ncbi:Bhlh transcription factor [Thalictrum thalictroides]|uniref:Bhlh transcription factor n=1 Tax=Thalictrum thalictroides TaxID=46969 RepID=A0A7J6VAK0_THATH|nr:Bhlh transcription factor [Thalictrum thalictroides]